MKRSICLLLCILLVLPTVALFSSCKKGGDGLEISKKTVELKLENYELIKAEGFSVFMTEAATDLLHSIKLATGETLKTSVDSGTATDLEILLGETKRPETEKAKKSINGDGFTVQVINDKIVIVGTRPILTTMALRYFVDECLPTERTDGTLTLPKKTIKHNVPMLSLTDGDDGNPYTFIYNSVLDDKNGNAEGSDPANTSKNPDQVDYPVSLAREGANKLVKLTGISAKDVKRQSDKISRAGKEVMYGVVDREDAAAVLQKLGIKEYGIFAVNGNLMVSAWNDNSLKAASDLAIKIFEEATDNGKLCIPEGFEWRGAIEGKWISDFPKPEGENIKLDGVVDLADDSLGCYYTGSGVTLAAYESYCEKLVGAGYTLYSDNTKEGSVFRTYNKGKDHTLYVVYAAYAHAEKQSVEDYPVSIRVISAPMGSVNLVKAELLAKQTYTPIAKSSVTTVKLNYKTETFGMNYIVMLEDGRFIIFDGGGDGKSGNLAGDHNTLYSVLEDLYMQAHNGEKPSKASPLTVAAWIITHQHWDHVCVFRDFCKDYGSRVTIQDFYCNFISESEGFNTYNPSTQISQRLNTYTGYTNGTMKYYKLHSGMKLYYANAELEVIYTHEDLYPQRMQYFNDSSTVVRFTMHSSYGGEDVTMMFLGDLYQKGSRAIRAMYGTTIQTDIVQVAHHGYKGVEQALYDVLAPETLLWPTDSVSWLNQTKGSGKWNQIDSYIALKMKSVKYIIVQDIRHSTLYFGANGPEYDNLYNPIDHEVLAFAPYDSQSNVNYLIKR